jgi:hypothetical protein
MSYVSTGKIGEGGAEKRGYRNTRHKRLCSLVHELIGGGTIRRRSALRVVSQLAADFPARDGAYRMATKGEERKAMDTTTLIIVIVVLVLVFGGGGYYWRGRRR